MVICKLMKLNYLCILSLLFFTVSLSSCSEGTTIDPPEPAPVIRQVPLADPFIMLWKGKYYAYGTLMDDGIAVYVSQDLKTWHVPKKIEGILALHKRNSWGDHWFWAPEVYHVNGKFYMYYTAEEHILVATSESPVGPFKQKIQVPILENEKAIDPTLFIDDDGTPYLFFVRFIDGLSIWMAELKDNLINIKPGAMHKCLSVSQSWEKVRARVNEAPFVIKRNGVYYMTYSANGYKSPFYGVGYATATNITGPWTKYEGNPILQKPGDLVGTGHSTMFTDKNGNLRIVFHAHHSTEEIHPRLMYISSVSFKSKEGPDIMVINKNYMTPKLKL